MNKMDFFSSNDSKNKHQKEEKNTMSGKNDLAKILIISAAIIIASVILAWAIRDGARYLGDAINAGLIHP